MYQADPTLDASLPLDTDLASVIDILRNRRFTILTGAGISTDSGIPDYRSPGSPQRNPMTYEDFVSSEDNRRRYWSRSHIGWRFIEQAEPNDGHRAVADLELNGTALGVITQNVDALHEKAGSRHVVDLHGRNDRVICLGCERLISRIALDGLLTAANPGFAERFGRQDIQIAPDGDAEIEDDDFVLVACPNCGGILKPDVVFFGEMVPSYRVEESFGLLSASAALVVVGSSLTIHSGLRFARRAARDDKPVVIINRGPTKADELAAVKIDASATPVLRKLVHALTVAD